MRVIELSGEGQNVGRQHGEALRGEIREFHEEIVDLHLKNIGGGVTKAALEEICERNIPFLRRYSPVLLEELGGIAEGAAVSFQDVLFLNSFLELEDLRPPVLGMKLRTKPLWGCTTLSVLPEAARGGKTLLAQTYDMEPAYGKYNAVLKIARPSGTELIYTLAGVLGLNGMSDRGLGLVINKLVAKDARAGVIYPALVRQALSQERLGDAFGAVVFAPRATGMNYQLASRDGLGFCLELSAGQYNLVPFENGALAHTNHYLTDLMRPFETPNWLSHGGSYVRREVAARFLREQHGAINVESIMALTRDHTNYPRCVCAHPLPEETQMTACATIAAVIFDLSAGVMHACDGNPCQNEYAAFNF
ncbi:MAG: C45 family peptidase [Deltaproteobacteria bacterium]|jgi:isopenicillin-N N-acyltransferase-like protein|nr:C45 family peptidase [Deltaproteobacteria bacterium]